MEGDHKEMFWNIPSPIITDILSRLPIKTIFLCRSVCKTFLKLISEPEFVRLNRARSPVQLLINYIPSDSPGFGCLNLVEVEDDYNHHQLRYIAEQKMEIPKVRSNSGMTLIGSVNGLICINEFQYGFDALHIWNPATRECITLNPPGGKRVYPNVTSYGFGLSSAKGTFNLVHIFQEKDKNDANRICRSECHVYTLGKGSWRKIGHAPFLYNCRENGVFINGNLHWLIHDREGSEFISRLDLDSMLFDAFPSPPELRTENLATLNTYQGRLCVCDNTSDFDIVLWTMKEYGVKNSWTKEAVISKYPINLIGNYYEVVHVIKAFRDGVILLLWRDDLFLSYHLERKTLVEFDARDLIGATRDIIHGLEGLPPCIEATDYISSVLSLSSFDMEKEKVKVKVIRNQNQTLV